jgi:hypothetical protein
VSEFSTASRTGTSSPGRPQLDSSSRISSSTSSAISGSAQSAPGSQSVGETRIRLPSGSVTTNVRPKTSSYGSSTTVTPFSFQLA